MFVRPEAQRATKQRLLAAASQLFAERGFHGTTIREIAERAGANVAAGNYHYGSKKALYLEVLRAQFANIRAQLVRRGASRPESELRRLGRRELEDVLAARTKVMVDLLIGPPPSLHATLMLREMCDPSEALHVIVDEFIAPFERELEDIVAHLLPDLDRRAVEDCARSIVGQALFYRFAMPAVLRMLGLRVYPRGFAADLAAHITEFSLGGMMRVAASRGEKKRHAR
jgi:AcrR family transcriptional regulator